MDSLDELDGKTIGGMKVYVYNDFIEFTNKQQSVEFTNKMSNKKLLTYIKELQLIDAEAENRRLWDEMKEGIPPNAFLPRMSSVYFQLASYDVPFKMMSDKFQEHIQKALEATKMKARFLR